MIKRLWHELLYRITKLISVKNDPEYTQKITQVEVNKVKTMSKPIGDRVSRKMFRPLDLFNHMTEEDFMVIHNSGQMYNLCMALSVDLQPQNNEKDYTYTA